MLTVSNHQRGAQDTEPYTLLFFPVPGRGKGVKTRLEEQTRQQGTKGVKYLYEVNLIYMDTESLYRQFDQEATCALFQQIKTGKTMTCPCLSGRLVCGLVVAAGCN